MRKKLDRYNSIRSNIRTGDIILFSGRGPVSWVIKSFTKSRYSHVGIAYREGPFLLIFESTTLNRRLAGVYPMLLRRKLVKASGKVYVRHLNTPLEHANRTAMVDRMRELYGRPYEKSWRDLILTGLGAASLDSTGSESLSCGETVADLLQYAGILGKELKPTQFSPESFSSKRQLPTLNDYDWGEEIRIL